MLASSTQPPLAERITFQNLVIMEDFEHMQNIYSVFTTSSTQCLSPSLHRPVSTARSPSPNVHHPVFITQSLSPRLYHPVFVIQSPLPSLYHPGSTTQFPPSSAYYLVSTAQSPPPSYNSYQFRADLAASMSPSISLTFKANPGYCIFFIQTR